MDDELKNDLFWHALNYRTAPLPVAEQMWQELQACVQRLIDQAVEKERDEIGAA